MLGIFVYVFIINFHTIQILNMKGKTINNEVKDSYFYKLHTVAPNCTD